MVEPNVKFLGILILSFLFTAVLSVPFIDLLYYLKFYKAPKKRLTIDLSKRNPAYYKFYADKQNTPTAGGVLIVGSTFLFSILFYTLTDFAWNWTSTILFLTLFLFGLLGFYDDLRKFFAFEKTGVWGLRARYKLLLQIIIALWVGWLLFTRMNLHTLSFPLLSHSLGLGTLDLGFIYIFWAALVIIASTNAFNITDGLDGLATGLLMIALTAFWYLASFSSFTGDVTVFIAVLLGSLIAFLYFNIYPARMFMGDTGALALGAMLGVIALMVQKELAYFLIGGVFVVEAASTLIQWGSLYFRKKKVFIIAPLHHHFQNIGWPETKITMRFWLAGVLCAFVGILLALL